VPRRLPPDDSWGTRARKKVDPDLDITPMIDVTFLLLIFFMVASTMTPNEDRNVPFARHGIGIDGKKATIVRLITSRRDRRNPEIRLESGTTTLEELPAQVADRVRSGSQEVIIKAERDVPYAFVQKVARAATSTEGVKLSIGVQDRSGK
jgi:biopolymer transport protein ExbD